MSTKVKSPDNLPNKPGVYIMRDASDTIIYIGKAKNLIKRVKSYFREKLDRPKTQILMSHFDSLEYIVTQAIIMELTSEKSCCSAGNNQVDEQAGITQHRWQFSSR